MSTRFRVRLVIAGIALVIFLIVRQAERMFVLSFYVEGGHGPFCGLVAPLRARLNIGLLVDFRQPDCIDTPR